MKAIILSGGSGNDALLKGIYGLYPTIDLKVVVNAYDDGKSTGLCRTLTNTLGVSDIRKNHARIYKIFHNANLNGNIVSFFDERFDLPKGKEYEFVVSKLHEWGLSCFDIWAKTFFETPSAKEKVFEDFSIANIVYSSMYKELGYEATNEIICTKFDIPNNVLLNSFENVKLSAKTHNSILVDEASIVGFDNDEDRIESLLYNSDAPITINPIVVEELQDADMIIISCGTFWSSIYPTLEYGGLYRAINKSKAFKIWVMNSTQDKDARGIGSNHFISIVSNLGLDMSKFVVLENADADPILCQQSTKYDVAYYPMGNNKGKHEPLLLAKAIFKEFFHLRTNTYKHVLMDFDNTIYSKDNVRISYENIRAISRRQSIQIISGNDYKTAIKPILDSCCNIHNNVWADASSVLYVCGNKRFVIRKHLINKKAIAFVEKSLYNSFGIDGKPNNEDFMSCYKMKPFTALERRMLLQYLNGYMFKAYGIKGLKAISAGRTTIDIVASNNSKANIFKAYHINPKDCLYIGDETEDYGNDYEIAHACAKYIRVANVIETNIILKVL